jgi:hypothetical protein
MKPLQVLSLGAGVQSTTLLLMSIRGELPRLDAAIFADTQWEPKAVYEHLGWLATQAGVAGIPLIQVSMGNLRAEAIAFRQYKKGDYGKMKRGANLPLFILNPDGSPGMLRRQCTHQYKVRPIERCIKETVLGMKRGQRMPKGIIVEQWFGISSDEIYRMKQSREKWKRHVYPFCGYPKDADAILPRRFSRNACVEWLRANYPDRLVPRSACIGCPFHSDAEWRQIKADPEQWADAVDFDQQIRKSEAAKHSDRGVLRGMPYVHAQRVPLDQVDLTTDVDRGQGLLWGMGEDCEGMCGV